MQGKPVITLFKVSLSISLIELNVILFVVSDEDYSNL